jgi:glycosyltransferase involved in cell wall biosynthesis
MARKATSTVNVSFVIPAYNEVDNLRPLIAACHEQLKGRGGDHEIVIVEDGSTDGSKELLDELGATDPLLNVVHHAAGQNIGCHPSELEGFKVARGDALMFLPADLQILPSVLPIFLEAAGNADVIASRRLNRADYPWRRWLSRANNAVERRLMGVDIHDAHSSMMLTRRAADLLVPQVNSSSALIPAELLVRGSEAGLPIAEVEIEHHRRVAGKQTGAKFREVFKVWRDLYRLRRTLRRESKSLPERS